MARAWGRRCHRTADEHEEQAVHLRLDQSERGAPLRLREQRLRRPEISAVVRPARWRLRDAEDLATAQHRRVGRRITQHLELREVRRRHILDERELEALRRTVEGSWPWRRRSGCARVPRSRARTTIRSR
jgi:hypothetical protein